MHALHANPVSFMQDRSFSATREEQVVALLRALGIDEVEYHLGGTVDAYLGLHAWFLETRNWSAGPEHLVFRHHAFGIFEAEARFGPVIALGAGKAVPTRVVAERHVQGVLGRVPPASEFLRRIKAERWMLQATSPRKLGLD